MGGKSEGSSLVIRGCRYAVIGASIVMMVVSGHAWNTSRIVPPALLAFDFFIAVMLVFVLAVLMEDASENKKNISAIAFFIAALGAMLYVFG